MRALAGAQRRIASLGRADSLGIDFHKTGFTPYVSSLFLLRDAADFKRIARSDDAMPYLFQSGHYHPGKYTLETTRGGSGRSPRWPTCSFSARTGCVRCWGTW